MFMWFRDGTALFRKEAIATTAVLGAMLQFTAPNSFAADVTLQWDPATQAGLAGYKVYYGESSNTYTGSVDTGTQTSYTVTDLSEGKTYYFAVTAYGTTGYSESGYSNEVSKIVSVAVPVADFSANVTSGTAPLAVLFSDTSTGNVTDWSWNFGNGTTGSGGQALITYNAPGTYTVSLTASGPGGSNTKTKSDYITVASDSTGGGGSDDGSGGDSDDGSGGGAGTVAGLVAAYGFDEASGSLVSDASGNYNDGMIEGATRVAQGRFGKALSFNGNNAWVTVNDAASLDLSTGMALQAWVYPTVSLSGWRSVILKENAGGASYYLSANSSQNKPVMAVQVGGERSLYGTTQLPANTWTHLAATYDGTTQRLYVNGVEVASRAQTGSIAQSDGPLRIGGNSVWGEFFTGLIDEVRVYNRVLTASEIQKDMNTAVAP